MKHDAPNTTTETFSRVLRDDPSRSSGAIAGPYRRPARSAHRWVWALLIFSLAIVAWLIAAAR